MTNDRPSGLALISIERDLAENIDFEATINRFASMKSRRKQFIKNNFLLISNKYTIGIIWHNFTLPKF